MIADDAFDSVLELQRNIIILQALHIIAREAGEIGHDLKNPFNLGAFKGQPSRHDHANIAGTEDHKALAGHETFYIYPALGGAGSIYTRRACAGQAHLGARAFTAAHGKDQCFGLKFLNAALPAGNEQPPVRCGFKDHAVQKGFHLEIVGFFNKALSVAGAGQVFFKYFHAKTVMDALQ